MLKFVTAVSLAVATASLLFCYSKTFPHHGERSLVWEILLGDINVEMLCWYILINNVHIGTPAQAYMLNIANNSLSCDDEGQR